MNPNTTKFDYSVLQFMMLIVIMFNLPLMAVNAQSTADLKIKFKDKISLDSVQVTLLWDRSIPIGYIAGTNKTAVNRNHKDTNLRFSLNGKRGVFIIKTFKGAIEQYSPYFPINSMDKVQIEVGSDHYFFKGKGAEKMNLVFELNDMHEKMRSQFYDAESPSKGEPNTKGIWERQISYFFGLPLDSLLGVKLAFLNKNQKKLLKSDFFWLKANTILNDYFFRITRLSKRKSYGLSSDSTQKSFYSKVYLKYIKNLYPEMPDSILMQVPSFGSFQIYKMQFARDLDPNFPEEKKSILGYLKGIPNLQKEIFVTSYLLSVGINNLPNSVVTEALKYVKDEDDFKYFSDLQKNIRIGSPAFNFQLENTESKKVRLSDFKGKVVFMDFWFTGCKWCKVYYEDTLKEVEEHFKGSKDIVFLSICIDRNKQTWLKSNKSGEYNGAESINLYTEGQGADHQLTRYYNISSYPTQLIVDKGMKNYNFDIYIKRKSAKELIEYLRKLINSEV